LQERAAEGKDCSLTERRLSAVDLQCVTTKRKVPLAKLERIKRGALRGRRRSSSGTLARKGSGGSAFENSK